MQELKSEIKSYLRDTLIQFRHKPPVKNEDEDDGKNIHANKRTQEQMADLLHITPRAYGELERGGSTFSATTLIIFLTMLDEEERAKVISDIAEMLAEYEEGKKTS